MFPRRNVFIPDLVEKRNQKGKGRTNVGKQENTNLNHNH